MEDNMSCGGNFKDLNTQQKDTEELAKLHVPIPKCEFERLQTLRATKLLDTEANEGDYGRYVNLAARLFKARIALVSLVDMSRVYFKAKVGLDASEAPRDIAFCSYVILESAPEVLIVPDATQDPRFCNNPIVLGFPHMRFYAGAPLRVNGVKIGTLCILDSMPRSSSQFGDREASILQEIAAMVTTLISERHRSLTVDASFVEKALETIEEEKASLDHDFLHSEGEWLPLSSDQGLVVRLASSNPQHSTKSSASSTDGCGQQSLAAMLSSANPSTGNVPMWRKTACNIKDEIERLQVLTRPASKESQSMQQSINAFTHSLPTARPSGAPLLYSYPELFSLIISTLSPHSLENTKLERLGLQLKTVKEHSFISEDQLNGWIDFSSAETMHGDPDIAYKLSRCGWDEGFVMLSFTYSLYGNKFPASIEVLQRLIKLVEGSIEVKIHKLTKNLSSMQIQVGIPCLLPTLVSSYEVLVDDMASIKQDFDKREDDEKTVISSNLSASVSTKIQCGLLISKGGCQEKPMHVTKENGALFSSKWWNNLFFKGSAANNKVLPSN